MAFNWQTFRTRSLTAAVFVVVMLAGLLWNQWSFLILFSIIHFGCWWEYLKLIEKIRNTSFHIYFKLGMMLLGYGLMLGPCNSNFQINHYGLRENLSLPISTAGFALMIIGIFQKNKIQIKAFGAALLGLIYISLSWGLMMNLYGRRDINIHDNFLVLANNFIPIVIIASIWINDTMAYIVGSLIGKTPLSKVSPKKTWEGTVGGIVLSVAVMGLFFTKIFYSFSFLQTSVMVAVIAFIAAVVGTFGDLLESKLKRMAGVKDSGHIMPGHGGFLDRFDSLLLAVPAVWIYHYFILQ